ncbi:MAG TPA: MarC family protein [bacterium]|nr:MarC family protein [bacterium]
MRILLPFLHLVFVGFVSLFPPVNPPGSALMIDPLLKGLNGGERKNAALRIALYAFLICSSTIFIGSWIFKLFGISLPVVQIAGGILICKMGWGLLSSDDSGKGAQETAEPADVSQKVENMLFYPLAFPMTTGAGTISVLLTLSAHGHDNEMTIYLTHLSALIVSIILMCLLVYFCYSYTPALIRRLGPRGSQVLNRLSAFLVFCVGLQIASEGLMSLIKG